MGSSQADKARTHERIVEVAARRFRERGLDGIGVAELMKEAGLTVGGFYKHFDSRDDLVTEAINSTLGIWQARVDAEAAAGEDSSFAALVDDYLSPAHRDNPGRGCPFGALVGELARSDAKTRHVATEALRRNFELLAGLLGNGPAASSKDHAMLAYSAMIGAIALSRMVDDDKLSRDILRAVDESLKSLLGQPTDDPTGH